MPQLSSPAYRSQGHEPNTPSRSPLSGLRGASSGGHRGGKPPERPRFRGWRLFWSSLAGAAIVAVMLGAFLVWHRYEQLAGDLPSVGVLKTYQPPIVSRIYADDDQIMAELAAERRIYTPINAIPQRVKNAFIAAEDQSFYTHHGIDFLAILRAEFTNLLRAHGRRPIGASTITQQVARNMLLNNRAVTLERKEKEALLALRIERVLPKDKILEIYLNGIYLGEGSYGVAAAAQTYFGKPLDALNDAEAAYLAALPKSPANYNPFRYPDRAIWRRNWVLSRMAELHDITPEAYAEAIKEPLVPRGGRRFGPMPNAEWYASEVRRELIDRYGLDQAMRGGLEVHTSLDPVLQAAATRMLRDGLMAYDRTHRPWQGAITSFQYHDDNAATLSALNHVQKPPGMLDTWRLAVVLSPTSGQVLWLDSDKLRRATLLPRDLTYARAGKSLLRGDVIMIEPQRGNNQVMLRQIPDVEGALISLDVKTGRIIAMVGGWSFKQSQFNRATQALRQPGSSFKPIVYLDAMENGVPPSQKFDDAPITIGNWQPKNYEKDNWGPTTLHDALRESRNLVTVRLAAYLGMNSVADMARNIGIVDKMPHVLPAALGAVETTVLKEAGAYASIASGGRRVTPGFIDSIADRNGHILWKPEPFTLSEGTQATGDAPSEKNLSGALSQLRASPDEPATLAGDDAAPVLKDAQGATVTVPILHDMRAQIASPASAYQVIAMLQDVIARGTGAIAGKGIAGDLAGKTGTSQDFRDAWFAGFSPEIATVVWVGYDTPRSLGKNETGARVAGPIWNKFMKVALGGRRQLRFQVPRTITLARYDTGRLQAVDGFKNNQVPGVSIALHGFGAGTEPLTDADNGNDLTLPEDDVSASGAQGNQQTSSEAEPQRQGNQDAASRMPADGSSTQGDIGLGGLY